MPLLQHVHDETYGTGFEKVSHSRRTLISRGYSLVELIVAVGLFALIMLLASGAYLLMIGISHQSQSIATGIDNLSFALESMTRSIRTGTEYACNDIGDCSDGTSFSFKDSSGSTVSYRLVGSSIYKTVNGVESALTDPNVIISALRFYAVGTRAAPADYIQPRVTMLISGTVSYGEGKTESFSVQTGATMRGTDI